VTWRNRRALLSVLLAILIGAGTAWALFQRMERVLSTPIPIAEPQLFDIEPGQSITKIAVVLAAKGWLESPLSLRIEATRRGVASRIQAGTYEVTPGLTPRTLLAKFVQGDIKRYQFTVVEGSTFIEMRELIKRLPGVRSTLAGVDDLEVMQRLGAPDELPEGRFFPSTYFYKHRTPDLELLRRAYAEMQRILTGAWAKRQADLPLSTPYEALILASIIEKETARPFERAAIGGVFVRRLQLGMKLQTDPTVIYGLGTQFDGNLRREDLLRDTPFNTYTRAGLPPTPIAMPGADAIAAAVNPAPGSALYFVARGDGTHEFSDTLTAHQRAVRAYQLK